MLRWKPFDAAKARELMAMLKKGSLGEQRGQSNSQLPIFMTNYRRMGRNLSPRQTL